MMALALWFGAILLLARWYLDNAREKRKHMANVAAMLVQAAAIAQATGDADAQRAAADAIKAFREAMG